MAPSDPPRRAAASSEEDPFASTRMSLGDHLDELRTRLIRGVAAVAIAFALGMILEQNYLITDVVLRPMRQALAWVDARQVERYEKKLVDEPGPRSHYFESDDPADTRLKPEFTVSQRMAATGVSEGFLFQIKEAGYFALVLGAPILIWQLWQFVAAGLYPHERRLVGRSVPVSVAMFAAGVLFGYFLMVPYGLFFLITTFSPEQVQFLPSLSDYLSVLTLLTVTLGFVFQLPLLMFVLVRVGLVPRSAFAKYRRHFIVGTFILGALVTPPDPYTQVLLAVPMIVLYEVGLWITRWVEPRGRAANPEAQPQEAR